MTLVEQMDSHRYLCLSHIEEPEDNALRLLIDEAKAVGVPEDVTVGEKKIPDCTPIVSDETCSAYELLFTEYIAYSVRNESYTVEDEFEGHTGRLFCVYTRSQFLDYVRRSTFATGDYPGPLIHYRLNCLNHVVDVASLKKPAIRMVREGSIPDS